MALLDLTSRSLGLAGLAGGLDLAEGLAGDLDVVPRARVIGILRVVEVWNIIGSRAVWKSGRLIYGGLAARFVFTEHMYARTDSYVLWEISYMYNKCSYMSDLHLIPKTCARTCLPVSGAPLPVLLW